VFQSEVKDGTGDKPADVLFGSFYHGRDLCVDVTIVNPFTDIHKKIRDPDSFLQSAVTHKRQHYAARCSAAGKLFAVCAFEVSGGIYLSEMKSVLKRIHRGISERSAISYVAAETRVHQRLSFTLQRSNAYSLSLQSTAATRGS
jgi:hypothetical protein